ncbi:hypothetical protein P7C73_g813, partial [Tremellales sp. Uapishka_1]
MSSGYATPAEQCLLTPTHPNEAVFTTRLATDTDDESMYLVEPLDKSDGGLYNNLPPTLPVSPMIVHPSLCPSRPIDIPVTPPRKAKCETWPIPKSVDQKSPPLVTPASFVYSRVWGTSIGIDAEWKRTVPLPRATAAQVMFIEDIVLLHDLQKESWNSDSADDGFLQDETELIGKELYECLDASAEVKAIKPH